MAIDARIPLQSVSASPAAAFQQGVLDRQGREQVERNALFDEQRIEGARRSNELTQRRTELADQQLIAQRQVQGVQRTLQMLSELEPFVMSGDRNSAMQYLGDQFRSGNMSERAFQRSPEILNPDIFQRVKKAQLERAQQLGIVQTPRTQRASGIEAKLVAEGLQPGTPEFQARARELNSSSGITINTGDQVPLDKTNARESQQQIVSAGESLARLNRIKANYDPSFLTYGGKIKNAVSGFKSKAGIDLSTEERQAVRQYRRFSQSVDREFNAYRKLITGAAAAIAELESLKKATINTDLSPDEFEAAFDEYADELRRTIRIRNKLLRQGISEGSEQFGRELDEMYLSNDDDTIEERGNELEAQGLGPEQIADTLQNEGYF